MQNFCYKLWPAVVKEIQFRSSYFLPSESKVAITTAKHDEQYYQLSATPKMEVAVAVNHYRLFINMLNRGYQTSSLLINRMKMKVHYIFQEEYRVKFSILKKYIQKIYG